MPDKTIEISLLRAVISDLLEPFRRPALAAVSGASLALAFPYASLWPIAFVGVAPVLSAVDGAGPLSASLLGWLAGAVFFAVLAYWIGVFGAAVIALFIVVMGLYFALFALGARWALANLSRNWRLVAIPALWVEIEYARSFGTYSFPWGNIGESITNLPLMQLASIIGGFGLSFIAVMTGVIVYEVKKSGVLANLPAVSLAVVFVLFWYGWGLHRASAVVPSEGRKIAVLQGNVPQEIKMGGPFYVADQKALYLKMTREAARKRPNIIAWPESAVPVEIREEAAFLDEVRKAAGGADVILGAFDRDRKGIYNAAFLLKGTSRAGVTVANDFPAYRKIHLVPWGEFTPLRTLSAKVNPLAGLGEDQTPGEDLAPLQVEGKKIATLICFESAYSRLAAQMVRAGARVGLVITNDGWFGKTSAAEQHFQLARFRAVENGIYAVQAANTGISGIIDPTGRVVARTELNERAILAGRIGYSNGLTPYARLADFLPFAYSVIIGAAIAAYSGGKRKTLVP